MVQVKSSTSQKPEYISDVAVQARIAAASGIPITATEVMHLNKEFRFRFESRTRHGLSGEYFQYGDGADVLEPESLREAVRRAVIGGS